MSPTSDTDVDQAPRLYTVRRFPRPAEPDGDELVRRAVARAQQGDLAALRFLYVRFADDVWELAHGVLRDAAAASEVTRRVFAGLADAIGTLGGGPFADWILTLAREAALQAVPPPQDGFGAARPGAAEAARRRPGATGAGRGA